MPSFFLLRTAFILLLELIILGDMYSQSNLIQINLNICCTKIMLLAFTQYCLGPWLSVIAAALEIAEAHPHLKPSLERVNDIKTLIQLLSN